MNDYLIKFDYETTTEESRGKIMETFNQFIGVFESTDVLTKAHVEEKDDFYIYFKSPLDFAQDEGLFFPLFGNKGGFCDFMSDLNLGFYFYDRAKSIEYFMMVEGGRPFDWEEEEDEEIVEDMFETFFDAVYGPE